MTSKEDRAAEIFLRRKQKNLDYFKINLPRIYQLLENLMLTRAELVVTPGAKDLDMVVDGKSCYRGLAKEYSKDEVLEFLKDNPPEQPIKTFPPQWARDNYVERFGNIHMQRILRGAPVAPNEFEGYFRTGNCFPMVVFLGCGLGYHIEEMVERLNLVNVCVVERDPEKFALSLFTVDWAHICSRFHRKGYSINFAVGFGTDDESMRDLLARHLKSTVPFYPYFTTYYNHLADVELAKSAMSVSSDLAVIAANWSNYDDQLIRIKNTDFNVSAGLRYIRPQPLDATEFPVVIFGSGPSVDHRIESLKANREKVIVISAGTGLRPLLSAGIKPDLHVELDPKYEIYEAHADMGPGALKDIPLLATNEINPFVPPLFGKTRFYFKSDNAMPRLLNIAGDGFSGCNPTCTNAALSIAFTLGFRNVFLFGTDYGFDSVEKDHSSASIYGDKPDSEFVRSFRQKAAARRQSAFPVSRVDGGKILTRNDYFTAKRSMEDLIRNLEEHASEMKVFNCADGAVIEGASWLSEEGFNASLSGNVENGSELLEERLSSLEAEIDQNAIHEMVPEVTREIETETGEYARLIRKARLGGTRDLLLLANEIRLLIGRVAPRKGRAGVTAAQVMMSQLLQGSILRLVQAGVSHALASRDGKSRDRFVKHWRREMLEMLEAWPEHFQKVMLDDRPIEENPWARADPLLPEPGLAEPPASGAGISISPVT